MVMCSHIFKVKNCLVALVLGRHILDPCTRMERLSEGLLQRLTFLKQPYVTLPIPSYTKTNSVPLLGPT